MTISLQTPPSSTQATFKRAMAAIANHPERGSGNDRYNFLQPLRLYVLKGGDARSADMEKVSAVGWQYLISDAEGFAVVDLSDDISETFSSLRRGVFAARYEATLRLVDDLDSGEDGLGVLGALEIPQYGTTALTVEKSGDLTVYPISLRGILQPPSRMNKEAFFEALLKSTPPPRRIRDQGHRGPVI
jgi:hypothetical protein